MHPTGAHTLIAQCTNYTVAAGVQFGVEAGVIAVEMYLVDSGGVQIEADTIFGSLIPGTEYSLTASVAVQYADHWSIEMRYLANPEFPLAAVLITHAELHGYVHAKEGAKLPFHVKEDWSKVIKRIGSGPG